MTISEKKKYNSVKRHIKAEYAKSLKLAKDAEGNGAVANYHLGTAAAYLDCFRAMFYPDENMTAEMLNKLILT